MSIFQLSTTAHELVQGISDGFVYAPLANVDKTRSGSDTPMTDAVGHNYRFCSIPPAVDYGLQVRSQSLPLHKTLHDATDSTSRH